MTRNPPTGNAPVAQAVAAAIAGTAQTIMLRPEQIAPSPTNPRKTFPEGSLAELADSMAHDGQVQAILVREIGVDAMLRFNKLHPNFDGERPQYEIVSGERRWRAAQLKGLELRAEVRELSDLQVVRIQIIENLHREEVHPLEEAEGYEYLLKHSGEKITVDQIADEVGKSRSYVHKRLKLASLCEEARKKFLDGEFDASSALLIARIPTPALQLKAIEEVGNIFSGWVDGEKVKPSYRQIRSHLSRRFHLQLENAPFDITIEDLVPGCGNCIACPKRTGNQSALFDDVDSQDICTDPDCFGLKKVAAVERALAEARSEGLKVIEGEDAMALKPNHWRPVEGHKAFDAVAYTTDDGQKVTYAELVDKAGKKAPKPVVFVDPHSDNAMPEKLLSDEEAERLLKKFAPKAAEVSERAPPADDPEAAAREAKHRQNAIRSQLRRQLTAALDRKADATRTAEDLVVIASAVVFDQVDDELLEAAGVTLPPEEEQRDWDHESALVAALLAMEPAKLAAFTLRLAIGTVGSYYHAAIPMPALEAAAKSHQIDVDGLRRKAEELVDAEEGDEE